MLFYQRITRTGTKHYFIFEETGIPYLWAFRLSFNYTEINFIGYKGVLDIFCIVGCKGNIDLGELLPERGQVFGQHILCNGSAGANAQGSFYVFIDGRQINFYSAVYGKKLFCMGKQGGTCRGKFYFCTVALK